MPTYKITNPEAAKACKAYNAAEEALREIGSGFAARYPGSKAVYAYDAHGIRLFGLAFTPANPSPLWTRPQRDGGEIQRPRTAPAKNVKGEERRQQVADLKALNEEWAAHYPKAAKVDREPVLTAMGTDWGSAMICGISYFEHEGVVYVKTSMQPREGWQEIFNSEYEEAYHASKAAAKAVAA